MFQEIKDLFDSVGIFNFERIDENLDWKKKFAKSFSNFNNYLSSAKVQGFNWKHLIYDFNQPNGAIETITLNLDETTYLILVQRYKELFSRGTKQEDIPFDINTHITEIKTDTIDDGYMDSKFKLFVKNLSAGNPEAKETALTELYKTFATLSQEEQKFAKQFLLDLELANIQIDSSKTFRDYITEYHFKAYNDYIKKFSENLGLNEVKLRNLMNLNVDESNINEFGRLDDLKLTLDINKAKSFFEKRTGDILSLRKVKLLADNEIRKFIISGGYEV
jgi:type I restriction enzyme R subunit